MLLVVAPCHFLVAARRANTVHAPVAPRDHLLGRQSLRVSAPLVSLQCMGVRERPATALNVAEAPFVLFSLLGFPRRHLWGI